MEKYLENAQNRPVDDSRSQPITDSDGLSDSARDTCWCLQQMKWVGAGIENVQHVKWVGAILLKKVQLLKWGKGEKEREPGLVALLSQLAPEKKRTIGGHEDLGMLAMFSWPLGGIQTTKLDLVSSTVRYEVMKLFTWSVWGSLHWYLVVLSQYEGTLVGIYLFISIFFIS